MPSHELTNRPAHKSRKRTPLCRRDAYASTLVALSIVAMLVVCSGCKLTADRFNSAGRQAYQSGQLAQAIDKFQRALTVDPNNADAYYNLAATYYAFGKQSNNEQWLDQAEQLYRQAIRINDLHTDAHRGLACLLIDRGRQQHAFDLLTAWQQRYPTQSEPLIELARLHSEVGDKRRATDLLADAIRLDSSNPRALKAMGHLRETEGQYAQALENYQRALQIDPRQMDVAQRVGELQTRLAQAAGNPTR